MRKALLLGSTMLALPFAVFAMAGETDERLTALRDEVKELTEERDGIVAKADEASVDLTDDELEEIETITAKIEAKTKQIAARERVSAARQPAGRRSAPEPSVNANGDRMVGTPSNTRKLGAKGGFNSFGEFAVAVRKGINAGNPDQRLVAAATTYGSEGTGADGGFAVPQEFRSAIWQKVVTDDNLLTRTDQLVTGANSLTIPKDETTPWQSSGGILAYWESEAGQVTQSKPALEMSTIRLNKLMALVPMTDELLEDAAGMDSYLRAKAPAKMMAKLNTAIVRGTGAGQPLGILSAGSTIAQAIEAGPQTTDTVIYKNIVNMWSRLYGPCRRNAVWLINQDIEPQLLRMAFDEGATDKYPVYLPANGAAGSPYATLMGRPVVPVEACSTLGDLGDIILTDLSQYMTLTKGSDIKTDVSMHLFFDQALTAFRFIFRVAGQPWWGSTLAPQHGTVTRSWAVTLAAR
ncbi:MAG: putative major capsid protein [Rhodospirillaceae bacterium]|nr:MAG: putative major capsid protein [Rhodospirillaceae bacterium]